MSKTLRLFSVISILLIIGGIGTGLSRAGEKIKTAVWETVQPKLVKALAGEVQDVKVGLGYQFKELDYLGEAMLGLQWIVSPKKAGARQVLKVYDLNLMRDQWNEIRAEFREDPAKIALMTKYGDTYFGTPVKWTKGFASAMEAVWHAGFDAGFGGADDSNVFAQAAAEEIVTLAAYEQLSPLLAEIGIKHQFMKPGWPDEHTMDLVYARKIEAVKSLRPSVKFYIAFSREPKALSDVPLHAEVISISGWQGEILGETITGWPVDKHD